MLLVLGSHIASYDPCYVSEAEGSCEESVGHSEGCQGSPLKTKTLPLEPVQVSETTKFIQTGVECPNIAIEDLVNEQATELFETTYENRRVIVKGTWVTNTVFVTNYRDQKVAVKVLDCKDQLERKVALKECKLHYKLKFRTIISVFGICTCEEHIFLVLDFKPYGNMKQICCVEGQFVKVSGISSNSNVKIDLRQRVLWLKDVAGALCFLHFRKVMHRDVKCENVIIGEDMTAFLADLGYSRKLPSLCSGASTFPVGTKTHIAPEITPVTGAPRYSFPADIYSFGILVVELLEGSVFYSRDQNIDVLKQLASVYTSMSDYINDLRIVVENCTLSDPLERPTARDVFNAIEGISRRMEMSVEGPTTAAAEISFLRTESIGGTSPSPPSVITFTPVVGGQDEQLPPVDDESMIPLMRGAEESEHPLLEEEQRHSLGDGSSYDFKEFLDNVRVQVNYGQYNLLKDQFKTACEKAKQRNGEENPLLCALTIAHLMCTLIFGGYQEACTVKEALEELLTTREDDDELIWVMRGLAYACGALGATDVKFVLTQEVFLQQLTDSYTAHSQDLIRWMLNHTRFTEEAMLAKRGLGDVMGVLGNAADQVVLLREVAHFLEEKREPGYRAELGRVLASIAVAEISLQESRDMILQSLEDALTTAEQVYGIDMLKSQTNLIPFLRLVFHMPNSAKLMRDNILDHLATVKYGDPAMLGVMRTFFSVIEALVALPKADALRLLQEMQRFSHRRYNEEDRTPNN